VPYAGVADGTLTGKVTVVTATKQAAQLSADVKLSGADAAAVNLPLSFPYAVPSGMLGGQAALSANGDTLADWAGSLTGSATLTAAKGTFTGFDLAGLAQALEPKSSVALRKAATAGDTRYDSLTISGNFSNGRYNIGSASLLGPDGNASATGSIGGNDLALKILLMPKVTPPLTIGLAATGSWAAVRKIPDLKLPLRIVGFGLDVDIGIDHIAVVIQVIGVFQNILVGLVVHHFDIDFIGIDNHRLDDFLGFFRLRRGALQAGLFGRLFGRAFRADRRVFT
jgi:hypothetical protein